MPTKHIVIFVCRSSKQRGAALLIMLVLLVVSLAAVLVNSLISSTAKTARQEKTAAALAQAKDALIGYAVTYGDNHANQVFGYLPLPDLGTSRNNNVTPAEGNAAANFSGNTKNLTVIGRLPWRTLGLPPLRDDQGECLWYAVSGSFQNTQQADVLNWDSLGHFDANSSNGTPSGTVSTTGANYAKRPAAIIFSASTVLQGQNRQASTTDIVDICGGNYNASNYLDSFNTNANINNIINYFAGSTNNSSGYAYNLNNTSNGSQLSAAALSAPKNIIFGDIEVNIAGNLVKIVNDRILTITADDIFSPIIRRSDFSAQISALMNDAVFIPHLQAVAIAGSKGTDNVNCVNTSNAVNKNFCNNWKEMLLLKSTTGPCSRVLIFGGQKTATQVRLIAADKSDPANYLEGINLAAFATPVASSSNFSGPSTFNANNPSADLLTCLP